MFENAFNNIDKTLRNDEGYETRIRRMGNAGRNGGEYYTPLPLIRAMIRVIDPKLGETIYDGACGSAGFLCEAFEYLKRDNLSSSEWDTLQRRTFFGQEKKSLAYVKGIENAKHLVLPARPRPLAGQDQSAERRRSGRVR